MAELQNTFSWSFSAAHDFEECRRKRYWGKYGMWGGWDKQAEPVARKAYQLNKMDNIYSLQGTAAEEAVMWALRELQKGREVDAEKAYQMIARPLLNKGWQESKKGVWRASPKKHCCLREHYYKEWDADTEKQKTQAVIEHTRSCLAHFIERVWPRLQKITRSDEIPVAGPGGGDPEHFMYGGVKIYAIPDYVYTIDDQFHIHDWKTGRPRESHRDQLAVYGLWAKEKHGVAPNQIFVYLEYLGEGKVAPAQLDEAELQRIHDRIDASVADMTEYLVDNDRARNQPLPKEAWDLAIDQRTCKRCNFYELCEPELKELT
jgi:CRISPR/Cas system-associated exonuclease Cas4 (RecB family)